MNITISGGWQPQAGLMPEKHKTTESAGEAHGLRPSEEDSARAEQRFSSSGSSVEAAPPSPPRDSVQRFPCLAEFVKGQKEKRQQELRDMHSTAKAKQGVRLGELSLSSYLLARAIDGRPVEDEDLQSLRKANDTVNETRRTLKYGRGNVKLDLLNTKGESSWRTIAGQNICDDQWERTKVKGSSENFLTLEAATAAFTGAGSCGEHGSVAAHIHAAKLSAGEKVHRVDHRTKDHGWAESSVGTDHEDRIVMDAWASGSAVFAPDSAYSNDVRQVEILDTWDGRTGPGANAAMNRQKQEFDRSRGEEWQSLQEKMKTPNYRLPPSNTGVLDPTPVIDASFVQRVVAKMKAPVNLDRLESSGIADENMPAAFNSPAQAPVPDMGEQLPRQENKIRLHNEIRAAGVARLLDANVKSATKHAATIVGSVKDMAS